MKPFTWNIFLACIWAAAWGEFTVSNLLAGFALGYGVLWLAHGLLNTRTYCGRLAKIVELVLYFAYEMVWANFRVAYDVITPRHRMRPGIFALPLEVQTDGEITLLANMISLTPGTVVLDISPDRQRLYIHAMYIDDVEQERQRLKQGLESRILSVIR